MDDFIERLRLAACEDSSTQRYHTATQEQVQFVETVIGVDLPDLLKRCYLEIGNGGFGPGYGLTGLPGGHESSWGDLVQSTRELRKLDDCEEGWLPLIDWGCAEMMCVDCDDHNQIVLSLEGEFHFEDYTFQMVLERWCDGEIPDLHSGEFYRTP